MSRQKTKIEVKDSPHYYESADDIGPREEVGMDPIPLNKPKRGFFMRVFKIFGYLFVFMLVALAMFSFFSKESIISENQASPWYKKISIIKEFKNIVISSDKQMKGEENDRINILLLGMGGKNHSGGYLTDTIMLLSLKPSTKKVSMLSVPRDLAVPIEGVAGWRKINNINAFAERKEPGSGGQATIQAVGDILDVHIDYFIRVDFDGFIKIIDELGGVEVEVDNNLDDYRYPVRGREDLYPISSRYEHLHVEKGTQTMDGELALKFARSRHGVGKEGSDFARAKRQQKILEAAKEKALSLNILLQPQKINSILNTLSDHISTNLEVWELLRLYTKFKDIEREDIINKVLDNSPSGLLVSGIGESGAYILEPKSGDFTEVQYLAKNIFDNAPTEEKTQVVDEKVMIEVQNGTWINGLAGKIAVDLEKYGFDVIKISNCKKQNFQKTVIYDLTFGKKLKSLQILKQETSANIAFGSPDWLIEDESENSDTEDGTENSKPDFIVILGQDAASLSSVPSADKSGNETRETVQQ